MLTELKSIFGTYTKAQEILLLLKNTKPLVRQGFYDEEIPRVEQFCKENNIHLTYANFKVILEESGFTNKGIKAPLNDPRRGMCFTYFAKHKQLTFDAANHEDQNNIEALGKLLNYPDCCIQFFIKNFSANNPNPELTPTNPYTNLTQRANDAVLISHFPCDSDCKESIHLAKRYEKTLREHNKNYSDILLNKLNQF